MRDRRFGSLLGRVFVKASEVFGEALALVEWGESFGSSVADKSGKGCGHAG